MTDSKNVLEEQIELNGIDVAIRQSMEQLSDKLIEQRKLTKPPEDYPKKEDLSQFKEIASFTLHDGPSAGVLTMDVAGENFILSGGKNGEAVLFDSKSQAIVSKFVPYYGNEIGLVKFAPPFSSDVYSQQPTKAIIAAKK